ncbi:MAG: glycosyl hydrolase [Bacteroidales bacterium]|jgi:mannan endo-1,4-beta-mannosidase|nr:glycosyl hydrolase [Bacteroidales bacterium]
MRSVYSVIILSIFTFIACSDTDPVIVQKDEQDVEEITLQIVDKNATTETKALYSNLWRIQSEGFMFGHHDDLLYGREWYTEQGRSDVKDVCGDYPAVYSVDFAEIMDDRNATSDLNDDRKRTILEAKERGEVITACLHINNPLTGGDSWDNSDNTVVRKILEEGTDVNIKYKSWLDNLAAFVNDLKDGNGNLIPILFRPYHEHTQTWSWWGRSCTTQEEFISFWKFTVDYLVHDKNIHNLIFAISPQLDVAGSTDNLLYRWPGDDYVDFIGMDSYHGTNSSALSANAKNLANLSKEKKKPCGITETGLEGIRTGDGEYAQYWTNEILTPLLGKDISMVVMWRNKYDSAHTGHHFYGPWIGHSSSDDFVELYNSSFSIFSSDLPDMYTMAEGILVE